MVNEYLVCPDCGSENLTPRQGPGSRDYSDPCKCSSCNEEFREWEKRKHKRAPCRWCGKKVKLYKMGEHQTKENCRGVKQYAENMSEKIRTGEYPEKPVKWKNDGSEKEKEESSFLGGFFT